MPPENGRAPPGESGASSETHCKSETQRPKHNSDAGSLQGLAALHLTAVKIVTKEDGTYRVDPDGQLAVLVPVCDRFGDLIDAAAFFPHEPDRWWLRYSDEIPVLGAQALAVAAWERQPIVLWETPLQWLLKRRSGCVVLDWGVDLRSIFDEVPEIACQSRALRDRLSQNFLRFAPKLTVNPANCRVGRGAQSA